MRNRTAAEDLVQEVGMKVLMACDFFIPGTNLPRGGTPDHDQPVHYKRQAAAGIQRSRSNARAGNMCPAQEDLTDLRELNIAFQRLPKDQRDALRLIAVEERSYEEVATTIGCAIGTLKSRVHRARLQLRSDMSGETKAAA